MGIGDDPAGAAGQSRPHGERALIPDATVVSNLLESLRVERTSFCMLDGAELPLEGASAADELIGFFFVSGQVRFSFDSGEAVLARGTDYLLIGRDTCYSARPVAGTGPHLIGRVTFKLDSTVGRLLFRLLPNVIAISGMSDQELRWQSALHELISHHPQDDWTASPAINHRLVEASLISLIQIWLNRNGALGYRFDSPDIAKVFPSMRAMHQAPERPWTVTSLARASGMSKTLFVARFKDVTGETPARYLAILRLDKGRELLRREQLSLSAVAQRTGYGTDIAFIRAFRRHFGVTPGRFRGAPPRSADRPPLVTIG